MHPDFAVWTAPHLYSAFLFATSPEPAEASSVLWLIDQSIRYTTAGVAMVLILRWAIRGRIDPLQDAPPRQNSVREESLLAAVLTYVSAFVLVTGGLKLLKVDTSSALVGILSGNLAQLAGLAACVYVADRHFDGGLRRFIAGPTPDRANRPLVTTLFNLMLAIGLCPVILEITIRLIRRMQPGYELAPHQTIQALQGPAQPIAVVVFLWLGATVIAPLAEEWFFRGLVQTYLVGLFRRRWLAIGVAAVAFGLVHSPQPYAIPALILLAVLLGCSYERTGALWSPIAIHAVFNLKTLIWEALGGSAVLD